MKKFLVGITASVLALLASAGLWLTSTHTATADSGSRNVVCTATISPGGIATLTTFTSAAIACPQVHMGDFVLVSALTTDPGAVSVTGKVTSAGNIKVVFSNTTAGTVTPASDTYSAVVIPRYISP